MYPYSKTWSTHYEVFLEISFWAPKKQQTIQLHPMKATRSPGCCLDQEIPSLLGLLLRGNGSKRPRPQRDVAADGIELIFNW